MSNLAPSARWSTLLRLGLLVVILMTGCPDPSSPENFVTVPASDSTLPTAALTVNDGQQSIDVTQASQPLEFRTRASIVSIIAGGTDSDGGILAVRVWENTSRYSEGVSETPVFSTKPFLEDVSSAKIGEPTLKNRFILHNFDMDQKLGSWSSMRVDVWVEAENFHSGKAKTPKVTILYRW
jgi:hypothetical protein